MRNDPLVTCGLSVTNSFSTLSVQKIRSFLFFCFFRFCFLFFWRGGGGGGLGINPISHCVELLSPIENLNNDFSAVKCVFIAKN